MPTNSRHVHAGKVFPGAMGIFYSKIWHRAVMRFDPGGEVAKKKSSSIGRTLGILTLVRMIHSRAEENSSKRKGADLRPNGRTISKK